MVIRCQQRQPDRWRVALAIGMTRHFQPMIPVNFEGIRDPLLFAVAMLSVAINLSFQGSIQRNRSGTVTLVCWTCAGMALWLGSMHGLDVVGFQTLAQQAPLLSIIPLAFVLLAPHALNREMIRFAVTASHGTLILGLLLSAVSVGSTNEVTGFLLSGAGDASTLSAGILFLELAAFYFATHFAIGSRWNTIAAAILCSLVSGWKLLVLSTCPKSSNT